MRKIREMKSGGMGGGGLRPKMITALDKIYSEIELMKQLKHTHLVQFKGVIDEEESDALYIVLQYANRGSLMQYNTSSSSYQIAHSHRDIIPLTRFGGIQEEFLREVVKQLISVLEYLHSLRIVHRDIKVGHQHNEGT